MTLLLEKARLFNTEGTGYDVLVASDAIGMGLNLNIRRYSMGFGNVVGLFLFLLKTIHNSKPSLTSVGGENITRNH